MRSSGHGAPQDPTDSLHISVTSWEGIIVHKNRAIDTTSKDTVQKAGDTHLVEGPLGAPGLDNNDLFWTVFLGSHPQALVPVVRNTPYD